MEEYQEERKGEDLDEEVEEWIDAFEERKEVQER